MKYRFGQKSIKAKMKNKIVLYCIVMLMVPVLYSKNRVWCRKKDII